MKDLIHLKSISDLHKLFNIGNSHHPLITVLDFNSVTEQVEQNSKITTDFYSIMFKNYCKNNIKYGRKNIDFQDGNLICIAPNQIIEIDNEVLERAIKKGEQVGLIAEDVLPIFPQLVRYKNGQIEGISYEKLPIYILQIVQDQQRDIEALQALAGMRVAQCGAIANVLKTIAIIG